MSSRFFDRVGVNAGFSVIGFGLAPFLKKVAIEGGVTPWMVSLVSACGAAMITLAILSRVRPQAFTRLFDRRYLLPLLGIGVVATGIVTLRASQYSAIVLLLLGLLVMNTPGGRIQLTQGFWLLLATLPLIGLTDVYSKRLTGTISPHLLAAGRNLYGALFIAGVALFVDLGNRLALDQALALLAAGGSQGIAVWMLFRAFERSKASLVSSLVAASPLVTLVLEVTLLDYSLTSLQWIGMLVVIAAAVWLAQTGERDKA